MRYVGELVWFQGKFLLPQKGEVTCLKSHSADKASRALGFSLFHVLKEDSFVPVWCSSLYYTWEGS